ncbi:MAG: BLUF domain-containing protein [Pseudomonadota bacterium]
MGTQVVTGNFAGESPEAKDDQLYTLGYASTQSKPLATAELLELLNSSREFNGAHDITGLLLHREDSFLQVMEGRRADIKALYERIKVDPRHTRVEILFEDKIERREFSDWQMGFIQLDGIDVSMLPGFSTFLVEEETPRTLLERLSRSRRLLLLFRSLS